MSISREGYYTPQTFAVPSYDAVTIKLSDVIANAQMEPESPGNVRWQWSCMAQTYW